MFTNEAGIQIEKVRQNEINDIFELKHEEKTAYISMPRTMEMKPEDFDDMTVEEFEKFLD